MPDRNLPGETTSNHSAAKPRLRGQRQGSAATATDEGANARAAINEGPSEDSDDDPTAPPPQEDSDRSGIDEKVDAIKDWRRHVAERPELWIGAAFVGGMLVAGVLKTKSVGRALSAIGVNPATGGGSVQAQARQFWHNMQGAFVGVASARIQQYLDNLVPGFHEHYRRAEQRATAVDPARS